MGVANAHLKRSVYLLRDRIVRKWAYKKEKDECDKV